MTFPAFFAQVPPILLRDPLAEFLGAAEGGLIEYRYADAVRLAGHSCPTVAGAYLLASRALGRLYRSEVPRRGNFHVSCGDSLDEGVTGVIASVLTLLTGAAGSGGFKGLAGQHSRRNLLAFGQGGGGTFTFRRRDDGSAVTLSLDLSSVPPDPRMGGLLQALLSGEASEADGRDFRLLWQDRVRRILLEHWDDPALVHIRSA